MLESPPAQPCPERAPAFTAFLHGDGVRLRRWRAGLPFSLAGALHLLVLAGLAMPGARSARSLPKAPEPAVPVSLTTHFFYPAAPQSAAPASAPIEGPLAQKRQRQPRLAPSEAVPRVTSPRLLESAAERAPSGDVVATGLARAATDEPVSDPGTATESGGGANESSLGDTSGVALASTASLHAAPVPVAPALSVEDARKLREAYLAAIFRSRIASRLFYPPSAEEDEIEGTVIVEVVIDAKGRLLSARVVSSTPAVLNHAALETVRSAQPFPPPPELLGARVDVRVSLHYQLKS